MKQDKDMSIPLKGTTEQYVDNFGNWSSEVIREGQKQQPEMGHIVVASGTLFCPKYHTTVLASECATCGLCLSPTAFNNRLGKFVVKCAHKRDLEIAEDNKEDELVEPKSSARVLHEASISEEYDWEAEKIAEIQNKIPISVTEQNWEQISSSKKLNNPNSLEAQILGSGSITKVPSAYEDSLGDRNKVAHDQVGIFDDRETVAEKLQASTNAASEIRASVQSREVLAEEQKRQWERDYLSQINDILENNKQLGGIKKIANESYETAERITPTGKLSIFDNSFDVEINDNNIEALAQARSVKKEQEWEDTQRDVSDTQARISEQLGESHLQNKAVYKVSEEIGAGESFKHGRDKLSMFEPSGLEDLRDEPDSKEIILAHKKAMRESIGVREATEDRSWDNYEAQRSRSIQGQTQGSAVFQEFLSSVGKRDAATMENFLIEAGKQSGKKDATENEGGFRRV